MIGVPSPPNNEHCSDEHCPCECGSWFCVAHPPPTPMTPLSSQTEKPQLAEGAPTAMDRLVIHPDRLKAHEVRLRDLHYRRQTDGNLPA